MGLDSVELVMDIEKHFSISIPDREAEKANTVGRLVDCIANILGLGKYDFSLREKTFSQIRSALQKHGRDQKELSLNDKVTNAFDVNDTDLVLVVESELNWKFPGIDTNLYEGTGVVSRIKKWFHFVENINFKTIKWKKYIDIILAFNLKNLVPPIEFKSKYEIYIAVMRTTVDKIGVDYEEIGIEKIFTDDLGVD